ncbi:reverse transcriptase-like protein [Bacillus sp. 03113]|uniref:reverse transcriptase-like protein n=1 Tax=Bacillus sp. 03113 TaxID=2578211 RepID=UPI0011423BA7|nr:reverse transcriptase-like protein [Bacillus sp. 03113]
MKYKLEWKYKLKGGQGVFFTSDWIDAELAIQSGEELEKSGKGTEITYYDEEGSTWNTKELKKLWAEIEEEPHDIVVFFDGGYYKEKKQAGLGVVLYYKQGKKKFRIRANELFDEMDTNNEAEYAAMYFAVSLLEEQEVHHMSCEFKGDSQVVLKQLEGEWPCYEDDLNYWLDKIEAKIDQLKIKPTYTPITRKENKEADKLATQALEGKIVHSKMQII